VTFSIYYLGCGCRMSTGATGVQARAVIPGPCITVDRRIDVILPHTRTRPRRPMAQHRRHNAIEWSKKQWDTAVEVLLFVRACAARREF